MSDNMISFRADEELQIKLDKMARRFDKNRSELLRYLIEQASAAIERGPVLDFQGEKQQLS